MASSSEYIASLLHRAVVQLELAANCRAVAPSVSGESQRDRLIAYAVRLECEAQSLQSMAVRLS